MDRPTSPKRVRDPQVLFAAALGGDRVAVGRVLSIVERGGDDARRVGRLTFAPSADVDQVVGITGSPGAGKSTLTDRLIAEARKPGDRVGVIAIDPTSPFSGGAILGDRVRMQGHVLDDGVFVRSMATRGHLGGLALAAPEAIRVLIATGMKTVLVETVGVGQVEVEIADAADTTIVVVNPGWGDAIQAAKAGLLEIADVFAINKADRPGAEETRRDLDNMLDMNMAMGDWRPPIVMTTATTGAGTEDLWAQVKNHKAYLEQSGELQKRRDKRLIDELRSVLVASIEKDVKKMERGETWEQASEAVLKRELDPYAAATVLLEKRT